jgi:hypothetical protein
VEGNVVMQFLEESVVNARISFKFAQQSLIVAREVVNESQKLDSAPFVQNE